MGEQGCGAATSITQRLTIPPSSAQGRPVTAAGAVIGQVLPNVNQRRHVFVRNNGPDPVRILALESTPTNDGTTLAVGGEYESWSGAALFAIIEPGFVSAELVIVGEMWSA